LSIFSRTGPASNLLLSRAIASGYMIHDPALERLAEDFPKIALDLSDGADSIRLKPVYDVLAGRPEATDKRHGTVATPAITRIKNEIAFMMKLPPRYIGWRQPVPIALPFTLTGGGRGGCPFVLRRECPEVCEFLYQAELKAREVEHRERRKAMYEPRRPLPPPFPWLKPFNDEEEES
jgi:hypothetical protein